MGLLATFAFRGSHAEGALFLDRSLLLSLVIKHNASWPKLSLLPAARDRIATIRCNVFPYSSSC